MKSVIVTGGSRKAALRLPPGAIDRRRAAIGEPFAVLHPAGIPAPGPRGLGFQRNHLWAAIHADPADGSAGHRRASWRN